MNIAAGTTPGRAGQSTGLVVFPSLSTLVMSLPGFALGPMAHAMRRDFAISPAVLGGLFSAYFVFSALLAGIGGMLSTRVDTVALIRCGTVGCAVLSLVVALEPTRTTVALASLVAGMLNGLTATSVNLMITDIVPEARRGLAFGIKTASPPASAAVAAVGITIVSAVHGHWTAIYAGNALLGLLLVLWSIRLPRALAHDRAARPRHPGGGNSSRRALVLLALSGLLGAGGASPLTPFIVDGLVDHGFATGAATGVLAMAGWLLLVGRVTAGGIADSVRKADGQVIASSAMLVVCGVCMAVLALAGGHVLLIAATLTAFGLGWAWPGVLQYAAIRLYPQDAARATSSLQSGTFLGGLVGPSIFGLTVEHSSFRAAWTVSAIAVVGASIGLIWSERTRRSAYAPRPERHGPDISRASEA